MDKLEKVRKEIERLRRKVMGVRTDFADGQKGVLTELLSFIDSMQEEPVIVDAPPYDYVKGFSDGRLYEKRQKEEPVSEKKCMYANDNYTDEDRKVLCEDCDHRCAYGVQNIGDYNHKAVIDAMMADVEEKSKAFTEAHKGDEYWLKLSREMKENGE